MWVHSWDVSGTDVCVCCGILSKWRVTRSGIRTGRHVLVWRQMTLIVWAHCVTLPDASAWSSLSLSAELFLSSSDGSTSSFMPSTSEVLCCEFKVPAMMAPWPLSGCSGSCCNKIIWLSYIIHESHQLLYVQGALCGNLVPWKGIMFVILSKCCYNITHLYACVCSAQGVLRFSCYSKNWKEL